MSDKALKAATRAFYDYHFGGVINCRAPTFKDAPKETQQLILASLSQFIDVYNATKKTAKK